MSNFEELLSKDSVTAAEYALATATHKALDVSQNLLTGHAHLVIGADTVGEVGVTAKHAVAGAPGFAAVGG